MTDKIGTVQAQQPNDSRAHRSKRKSAENSDSTGFANQMQAQATATAGARPLHAPQKRAEGGEGAFGAKSATSSNTGAATAGLQPMEMPGRGPLTAQSVESQKGLPDFSNPWSRDWVFDGADQNPNLRTFLQGDPNAANGKALANLQALLAEGGVQAAAGQNILTQQAGSKGSQPANTRGVAATNDLAMGVPGMEIPGANQAGVADPGLQALAAARAGHQQAQTSMDLSQLGGGAQVTHHSRAQAGGVQGGSGVSGNQTLSGAEFLNTLASVRGGAGGTQTGAGGFSGEQEDDGMKKSKDFAASALAGSGGAATSGSLKLDNFMRPTEIQGNVTQGSMMRDRLTSESLAGLSSNIRNLTPQGGGEIRVRLHPENLGEVHLRIVTDGSQVGLQIQASNDKAKKILEQSLGDLKDSLAKHQLSLGRVDLAVAPAHQGFSMSLGQDGQTRQHHHAMGGENSWNQAGNQSSNSWGNSSGSRDDSGRREWSASPLRTAATNPLGASASSPNRSVAGSRRLDVRA